MPIFIKISSVLKPMYPLSEYFFGRNRNKKLFVKLRNKNKKPVTFSHMIYDFNFDDSKRDYTYELFKTEVVCTNPQELFKCLIESKKRRLYVDNFWCTKKGSVQKVGSSINEFFRIIKDKKGLLFNYPLSDNKFYLIYNGISGNPKTFKLILYLNNCNLSYIDIISYFNKEVESLGFNVKINRIGKIKIPLVYKYNIGKDVPKLICTLGYIIEKDYIELYYFIKKPKIIQDKFIDNISNLLVWNNEVPIKYKEKNKFNFFQCAFLELNEVSILSVRASKY